MPFRRWMTIVIGVWVACAFAIPALSEMPASNHAAAPKLRIPAGARPTRYAVTLTIVPGAAKVAGEITIDLDLDRPHPVLWLNAVAVSISKVTLDAADSEARIITELRRSIPLPFGGSRCGASRQASSALSWPSAAMKRPLLVASSPPSRTPLSRMVRLAATNSRTNAGSARRRTRNSCIDVASRALA